MTITEAILKSLEEMNGLGNSIQVCDYIKEKKYYSFEAKTPSSTISADDL
jgi:hypothetical protein